MTLSTALKSDFYREILSSSLAYNTLVAYEKGWSRFEDYCAGKELDPLSVTPDEVMDFLIELATHASPSSGKMLSMGTVALYRSAINKRYVNAGLVSPTADPKVNDVLKGLTRIRGAACRQVKALRDYHIQKMLACCDEKAAVPSTRLIALRDAALIVTRVCRRAAAFRALRPYRERHCHYQFRRQATAPEDVHHHTAIENRPGRQGPEDRRA